MKKNINNVACWLFMFVCGCLTNELVNYLSTRSVSSNKSIEITARMIFTQQCSENFEQYFGQSQNSMFMSKEQMQVNLLCSELADRISYHISTETMPITEDNVVEVVDKAIGKMKKELAQEQELINQQEEETISPDNFI